jgi:uncharacterized membrane protein YkgB
MQLQATVPQIANRLEYRVSTWLTEHSVTLLRASLGIVFLGFGLLKFIPDASPAEDIATRVMSLLTFGLVPESVGIVMVALIETGIGLTFLTGRFMCVGLALLSIALIGIMAPMVLFPQDLLTDSLAPTLEGQYVFKDVVLAASGLVVALRERGARLILDRDSNAQ